MVSPCVARDLLQQRAPGLLAHGCRSHALLIYQQGHVIGSEVAEVPFVGIPAYDVSEFLMAVSRPMRACLQDGVTFDAIEALDLALLLEVTELYCLVCPTDQGSSVHRDPFLPLQQAVHVAPHGMRAQFAATSGEALVTIAEYLVEDVLLVSSGAAASASGSGAGPQAGDPAAATAAAAGSSQHGAQPSSSSSSKQTHPRAGGRNPAVTLVHRVWWAQDTVSTLCLLTSGQELEWAATPAAGSSLELGGNVSGIMDNLFSATNAPRVSRLLEVVLRTPELQGPRLQHLMSLLPWRLPLLHVAGSSSEGSRALLSAVTSASKAHQVGLVALSALVQAQGELVRAAAVVAAAVPGRMGQAVAQQVQQQPGMAVWHATRGGLQLASLAKELMARAAALLDPVLTPLAAYLGATRLPSGQNSRPWAVEAVLTSTQWLMGPPSMTFEYHTRMANDPQHMSGIMRDLTAALSLQQAAAVSKQAATLVKKAGGGAAEAEQLRQQLQGMWLGRDVDVPDGSSTTQQRPVAAGGAPVPHSSSTSQGAASSSGSSSGAGRDASQLPRLLSELCQMGVLKLDEVLAAGDPAVWSSALGPTSEADLRVASTALLGACKVAGAVAQLPLLVKQLQPIMAQQPWGRETVDAIQLAQEDVVDACEVAADWALRLAPLLAVLLPAQQAAELQEAAAETQHDHLTGKTLLTPATSARVLGLLGHVAAPGAPGCSYPGCCNLEGRSEMELRVQLCTKCRGGRYCCREHQVAHWKAGHKEVCRAAQAAVQQVRQSTASGGP